MDNICKFIPVQNSKDVLHTINLVHERKVNNQTKFSIISTFVIYLVTDGTGILHTMLGDYELKYGDLFITFPSKAFYIEKKENLQYMYISFLGLRVLQIFERLKINSKSPVISGFEHLIKDWEKAIEFSNNNNIDLLSESLLLYTFSHLSNTMEKEEQISKSTATIIKVKKYIEDNYCNSELSLRSVSEIFNYNPKYLSNLFKKKFGIGFSDYLQTLRIQHACELMQQGITTIKNIAYLVGYNDQLYFSRIFTKVMKISPKKHIEEMKFISE